MSDEKVTAERCARCGGSGEVRIHDKRTPHFPRPYRCSACDGTGRGEPKEASRG